MLPWELDIGCPSCGSAAGIRCVTMDTLYPSWWKFRDIDTLIGSPTVAHKARVDNWILRNKS